MFRWKDKSHKSLTVIVVLWQSCRLIISQKCHCLGLMFYFFVFFFQLVAMFSVQRGRTDSPRETMSNGFSSSAPSPEPLLYFPHLDYKEPVRGEIEVNEAILKASMSDLFSL